jgi:polysaccharide pyruvyl transferase WcaK-like protein
VIVAGSQQLVDYLGGPWAFPYTILKWSLLARLAGAKVCVLSAGAGPLTTRLGRYFMRCALSQASYRSYRDDASRALIAELGLPGYERVVPDLVFSLPLPPVTPRTAGRPSVVGINPLPYFDRVYWHRSDPILYERYVEMLARFADWLIDTDHRVVFFPTQLKVDPAVIDDIRGRMKHRGPAARLQASHRTVASFDDLLSNIETMDTVVATRYHAMVASFLLHRPVLGLAYHAKARDVMALMGQGQYSLDLRQCSLADLQAAFRSVDSRRGEIADDLAARLPGIRQALAAQYDTVFALLGGSRSER